MNDGTNSVDTIMPPEHQNIITARELNNAYPLTQKAIDTIIHGREEVGKVYRGESDKFVIGIGACGVRLDKKDGVYAFELFAKELKDTIEEVSKNCIVLLRANWEKPRTNVGWRGVAIDGTYEEWHKGNTGNINDNLKLIWEEYGKILDKFGIPLTSELLSPEISKSLSPLISMGWTGARNCESQTNRELMNFLSGLPAGVKHTKDGNLQNAIDSLKAIANLRGETSLGGKLLGNTSSNIILRGKEIDGNHISNYSRYDIDEAVRLLESSGMVPNVMIDCNHSNSGKNPDKQSEIALEVAGEKNVSGVLVEADLHSGRCADGTFGKSATDPCMSAKEASELILKINEIRNSL